MDIIYKRARCVIVGLTAVVVDDEENSIQRNRTRRNRIRRISTRIVTALSILHRRRYRQLWVGVPALRTRSPIIRPISLQAHIIRPSRHVCLILRLPPWTEVVSEQRVTIRRSTVIYLPRPRRCPTSRPGTRAPPIQDLKYQGGQPGQYYKALGYAAGRSVRSHRW